MSLLWLFFNISLILLLNCNSIFSDKNIRRHTVKPYITKCCGRNEIAESIGFLLNENNCTYFGTVNYSSIPIYTDGLQLSPKRIGIDIEATKMWDFSSLSAININFLPGLKPYLTESGLLYVELPNAYDRWTPFNNTNYCFDFTKSVVSNESSLVFNVWVVNKGPDAVYQDFLLTSAAMMVSSFFLALVLIVYALLHQLRNLAGLIVMAYAFTQMCAFLSLGILQILQLTWLNTSEVCLGLSPTIYFLFLAAFCWMNVMSFDIWWTFRGYAKARPIHRRGEKFKFGVYCAYAFGVPAAMTAGFVALLFVDMTPWPWFITPGIPSKACFLQGGELFLYLYVPMLIIIITNWALFLMTAYNVWRVRRDTAILNACENQAHRSHKQRFGLYLKLSVVMGVSWILEVISAFKPELKIWNVTDLYNLLTGLFIFLIFICKKKILVMLKKTLSRHVNRLRHGTDQSFGKRSQRSGSSSSTSSAYDYHTDQATLSLNPKGTASWTRTKDEF